MVEHWKALASTRAQIVDHLKRNSPAPYTDLLDRSEVDGHSGCIVLYWMSEYGQVVRVAVSENDSIVRLVGDSAEMIV